MRKELEIINLHAGILNNTALKYISKWFPINQKKKKKREDDGYVRKDENEN
jgi:hypothetical protein